MERGNVTISLPADLIREARHLAVDRGVSLSRFLAEILEERIETTRRRRAARDRQRQLLEKGLALGTRSSIVGLGTPFMRLGSIPCR